MITIMILITIATSRASAPVAAREGIRRHEQLQNNNNNNNNNNSKSNSNSNDKNTNNNNNNNNNNMADPTVRPTSLPRSPLAQRGVPQLLFFCT